MKIFRILQGSVTLRLIPVTKKEKEFMVENIWTVSTFLNQKIK